MLSYVRQPPNSSPQKTLATNTNMTRVPSPLRKSIRVTEYGTFQEDYANRSEDFQMERDFHLEHKYKELHQKIHEYVLDNIKVYAKYQHKDRLLSWIPSVILFIPLIAGLLTTLSTMYKKEGLTLAAGIATVSSTTLVALANATKANLNYMTTAMWYHDRASKLKEVQDQLSFAMNLHQYEVDEYHEHQSRVELLMNLPFGSDITGTQNMGLLLDEINVSRSGSAASSHVSRTAIPKALERQINEVISTKHDNEKRSRSHSRSKTPVSRANTTHQLDQDR